MTEDEAYKVHIQYTFNAFCKVVIRHAAIDKILKLRQMCIRDSNTTDRLLAGQFQPNTAADSRNHSER